MKKKIQYFNFEPAESEARYLNFKLQKISEDYPELVSCNVKVVKEGNSFKARISAKYVKMDVTCKWSAPVLLICIGKLFNLFDEKLSSASYKFGISRPIPIQRSSIFKYVKNYNHY